MQRYFVCDETSKRLKMIKSTEGKEWRWKNGQTGIILQPIISNLAQRKMEETTTPNPTEKSDKKNILVFAKHDYVASNATQLLEKGGFAPQGFVHLIEASDFIRSGAVDLVLIMGGVDPHVKMSLIQDLKEHSSQAKVVEHFGGPATILHEVLSALKI
jgi:hypothetical protein